MIKAVIFDLDGTLWDSVAVITEAWNEVFSEMAPGRETLTEDKMRSLMGKTLPEFSAALLPDRSLEEGLDILGECCRREVTFIARKGAKLYPRVLETLRELSGKYRLYIISNCEDGYIQAFLDYYGAWPFFEGFLSFGDTHLDKDENILFLMEKYGIDRSVYVGDTEKDRLCTRKAGIPFIHAAYGFGNVSECDERIDSFAELTEKVEKILG